MRKQIEGTMDLHPVYGVFPEVYVRLEERILPANPRAIKFSFAKPQGKANLQGLLNLGRSKLKLYMLHTATDNNLLFYKFSSSFSF